MYALRTSFTLVPEDIAYLLDIDSENIKPNQKSIINEMYSYYLDGKVGNYDLVKIEQQEDKSRNIARIKLRLLNWLTDYPGVVGEDFFFRTLSCRPAAQILVSKAFERI